MEDFRTQDFRTITDNLNRAAMEAAGWIEWSMEKARADTGTKADQIELAKLYMQEIHFLYGLQKGTK